MMLLTRLNQTSCHALACWSPADFGGRGSAIRVWFLLCGLLCSIWPTSAVGVSSVARAVARTYVPLITGMCLSASLRSRPFYLVDRLTRIDDCRLYGGFRPLKSPEERPDSSP